MFAKILTAAFIKQDDNNGKKRPMKYSWRDAIGRQYKTLKFGVRLLFSNIVCEKNEKYDQYVFRIQLIK